MTIRAHPYPSWHSSISLACPWPVHNIILMTGTTSSVFTFLHPKTTSSQLFYLSTRGPEPSTRQLQNSPIYIEMLLCILRTSWENRGHFGRPMLSNWFMARQIIVLKHNCSEINGKNLLLTRWSFHPTYWSTLFAEARRIYSNIKFSFVLKTLPMSHNFMFNANSFNHQE